MKGSKKILGAALLLLAAMLWALTGCGSPEPEAAPPVEAEEDTRMDEEEAQTMEEEDAPLGEAIYVSISQEEAKAIMDGDEDIVILDVRSQEEFDQGHIAGAILIPHDIIGEQAAELLPRQDQTILVYCRSGNRSKVASQALADLGYTNIKEFGGISTWSYDVVQ